MQESQSKQDFVSSAVKTPCGYPMTLLSRDGTPRSRGLGLIRLAPGTGERIEVRGHFIKHQDWQTRETLTLPSPLKRGRRSAAGLRLVRSSLNFDKKTNRYERDRDQIDNPRIENLIARLSDESSHARSDLRIRQQGHQLDPVQPCTSHGGSVS